jgi:tetratricopeptide (TPR) repeat protein
MGAGDGAGDEGIEITMSDVALQIETALAYHRAGRLQEAEAIYRKILSQNSNQPDALHWLGVIAKTMGHSDDAFKLIEAALASNPHDPLIHQDFAEQLRERGELDRALQHYRTAAEMAPQSFSIQNDMGVVYRMLSRYDEAIACFERAIELGGQRPAMYSNLGNVYVSQKRIGEGIAAFDRALSMRPNHVPTLLSKSAALFLKGDLAGGFELYENRLAMGEIPYPNFRQPPWRDQDLRGKTIAVVAEQGLGDTIMFVRFMPQLKQRGARTMLFCAPELDALLTTVEGVDAVHRNDQQAAPFDYHVPLLSLGERLAITLDTIPAKVPYVRANAAKSSRWREKLSRYPGLKVGLVWAGSAKHKSDRKRSMALINLRMLASAADVTFFSLQKGPAASQAKDPPRGLKLVDLGTDLTDFTETAAVIANLDLVIAVDTSVVHLAGAMATPVWTMLAYEPDWRWMLQRSDSPWYPTMKLFRQPSPGDWQRVVQQVATELSHYRAGRA